MLHDTLRGRVSYDPARGIVFVIDGIPLTDDEFLELFDTHEGWDFRVVFVDPADEAGA
jgi:hypothetical protein